MILAIYKHFIFFFVKLRRGTAANMSVWLFKFKSKTWHENRIHIGLIKNRFRKTVVACFAMLKIEHCCKIKYTFMFLLLLSKNKSIKIVNHRLTSNDESIVDNLISAQNGKIWRFFFVYIIYFLHFYQLLQSENMCKTH